MRGFSQDLDAETIYGSIVESRFQSDDSHRKVGSAVKTENGRNSFDGAIFHKTLRRAAGLFCRLEKQTDFTAEQVPAVLQDPCCRQQTCRVCVMAAGMHDALMFRNIRCTALFGNGESIDIRPESDGITVSFHAVYDAHDTGISDPSVRDVIFIQLPLDE